MSEAHAKTIEQGVFRGHVEREDDGDFAGWIEDEWGSWFSFDSREQLFELMALTHRLTQWLLEQEHLAVAASIQGMLAQESHTSFANPEAG